MISHRLQVGGDPELSQQLPKAITKYAASLCVSPTRSSKALLVVPNSSILTTSLPTETEDRILCRKHRTRGTDAFFSCARNTSSTHFRWLKCVSGIALCPSKSHFHFIHVSMVCCLTHICSRTLRHHFPHFFRHRHL